jgi:hypothetical protein
MDLTHLERLTWVEQVAKINTRLNEANEDEDDS